MHLDLFRQLRGSRLAYLGNIPLLSLCPKRVSPVRCPCCVSRAILYPPRNPFAYDLWTTPAVV